MKGQGKDHLFVKISDLWESSAIKLLKVTRMLFKLFYSMNFSIVKEIFSII